jgi:hypothetical protein
MRNPIPVLAFALLAAATAVAGTTQLPVAIGGADSVSGKIDPAGDSDAFSVFLGAGDTLKASARESAPSFGLFCTLKVTDPQGVDVTPSNAKGQGSQKVSLQFKASATGTHVVTLSGNPPELSGGHVGNYQFAVSVKRAKPAAGKFADAAGGAISLRFPAPAGSSVSISATTKKGGFDLSALARPDGSAEPAFAASVKAKKRRSASVSKFALTGGSGTYEVQGRYDAGSAVVVKVSLATNERKHTRRLGDDEPVLDQMLTPFPAQGLVGTLLNVAGINFDDITVTDSKGTVTGHTYPTFTLGGVTVPASSVTHPNGAIYKFPVPAGLATNQTYDLTVVNADGQGIAATGVFFIIPAPQISSLSFSEAGPAGGRKIRISGQYLRPGSSVRFGTTIVQPTTTRSTYIDVIAPPHAPGNVELAVRDDYGQTASAAGGFTYLNIGSNRITSVSPTFLQAVGGETVTVNGADFVADTVLTLDGAAMTTTLVSSSVMKFTAPQHADAAVKLRVTDQYDQTSAVDLALKGFLNTTSSAIPAPVTTTNAVDGWRATRVLVGDVDGDGKPDLVLIRPEKAFGNDANRSRLRLLLGNGTGGFSDATGSKLPAVSGDEDWRAKDAVLVDIDGDNDLDLVLITDDQVSSGARSSLRVLKNNGSGTFTDATTTSVPASTTYGDRNQGVAIAVGNFDGTAAELVITHTDYFTETIVTSGGPAVPPNPPPPDIITYNYFPGTRVLTNNGQGVFTRKAGALPAVTPTGANQFQGVAVAAANVDGTNRDDIVITRAQPVADPSNAGNFLLATTLLTNNGSAVFTDVTASKLPAKSDPEYLQGDRVWLRDVDNDGDADLVVASASRLVSPVNSQTSTAPAVRVFYNNGSGTFAAPSSAVLPAADDQDSSQADGVAFADLTGDGKTDLFVVSAHSPNFGARGARPLIRVGSSWTQGALGLPSPLDGDDLRGVDAAAIDVDGDGDLDLVIVRDEANDSVRNTLVLVNQRK